MNDVALFNASPVYKDGACVFKPSSSKDKRASLSDLNYGGLILNHLVANHLKCYLMSRAWLQLSIL